jgi:hypothetical protein
MSTEAVSFLMPFSHLTPKNRWVKLAKLVPWDVIEQEYGKRLRRRIRGGRRPFRARVAFGALIIKERLKLSDRETVAQIQENPYLQYFLGYDSFDPVEPFDPSLMSRFRQRLKVESIQEITDELLRRHMALADTASAMDQAEREAEAAAHAADDDDDSDDHRGGSAETNAASDHQADASGPEAESAPKGTMLIDATCAPADITHPTDLKVIDQARRATERVIDELHERTKGHQRKPRTYRRTARAHFVRTQKNKRLARKQRTIAARKQLRYLKRNLATICRLVRSGVWHLGDLSRRDYRKLLVADEVYRQQHILTQQKSRSIPDRIVSVSQPHIRPIVRGKAARPTEFGAKISVSRSNGFIALDRISYDAYYEGHDLPEQAEKYRLRFGCYPAVIQADQAYRSRANRAWCKARGIRLGGTPVGRPPIDPDALRARKRLIRDDEADRQPIEGVFGQAKRRFSMDRIMARLPETGASVIALILFVQNLERILSLAPFFAVFVVLALVCAVGHRFLASSGAFPVNSQAPWQASRRPA